MTYVQDRLGEGVDFQVMDADSHLMEGRDWLASYADPKIRGRLAPLNENAFPTDDPEYSPSFFEGSWTPEKQDRARTNLLEAKHWGALGAVDSSERPEALDLLGFARQIVFPSFSWGQFDAKSYASGHEVFDLDLLYGGAAAHNRGIIDFCSVDSRLLPGGLLPMESPERSIRLAEQAINAGARVMIVPTEIPEEFAWSHPDFEPVWAVLAEAHVPVVLHIGTGNFPLPKSLYNTGRTLTPMLGEEGWVPQDLFVIPWTVQLFLQNVILDGVLERHPDLRILMCEYRIDEWLAGFLQNLNRVQRLSHSADPKRHNLSLRASEYFERQVRVAMLPGAHEPLGKFISQFPNGERLFVFNSDYPHGEGGVDPLGAAEAEFERMDRSDLQTVRRRFYQDNFLELIGEGAGS